MEKYRVQIQDWFMGLEKLRTWKWYYFQVYKSLVSLRKEPALSHGNYHLQALTENTFVLIRHLITFDTYALVFNVGDREDAVDLDDVEFLKEPMTVYVSSVHSSRVAG